MRIADYFVIITNVDHCFQFGVGYNTPSIMKYPFWQMTVKNPMITDGIETRSLLSQT